MKVVSLPTLYEMLRETIPPEDAVKFYGLDVDRSHNAVCPFHPDGDPSLHIYEDHYHCFGCGAHGDVTDFVARLFGMSQYEAAKKLCRDFGIYVREQKPMLHQVNTQESFRLWLQKAEKALNAYLNKLCLWRTMYAPHSPEEMQHPRFVESLTKMSYAEYVYDMLKRGSEEDRRYMFLNNRKYVDEIIDRFQRHEFTNPVQQRRAV